MEIESYTKENSISLSIRFTLEDGDKLREIAAEKQIPVSRLVRYFVKDGLKRAKKNKNKLP